MRKLAKSRFKERPVRALELRKDDEDIAERVLGGVKAFTPKSGLDGVWVRNLDHRGRSPDVVRFKPRLP